MTLWELMERKRPCAGYDGFQIQTQWYLDPAAMSLPPATIPASLSPQGRQILETLAVSGGGGLGGGKRGGKGGPGAPTVQHRPGSAPQALPPRNPARMPTHTRCRRMGACVRVPFVQGLVVACTQLDPDVRPSFREVLATLRAAAGEAPTPRGGAAPAAAAASPAPPPL